MYWYTLVGKISEKQGYDEDMISRIAHATVFNPYGKS